MAEVGGLPELDVARVRRWCRVRVPDQLRDQMRVECEVAARHLTILECRPRWVADRASDWTRLPVARLRYTKTRQEWTLYWHDSNEVFHRFDPAPPSRHVEALLTVLDQDPTCIFWG